MAAEMAGIPTASLVCEGFLGQAASTAAGFGMQHLPLGTLPGHVGAQSKEELAKNVRRVTLDKVIMALTVQPEEPKAATEPGPRDVIFTGTFEEVNEFYYANELSDGLPIVPPTKEKVEEFLKYTDRSRDEVIGILLPDNREATIWNIAVNGVMAGCRPEYMPVLVALIEAMADPEYGVEHSGNTPGSETLITINGPIIKDLKFNYEQGVLRDGFQPNTSIGRFWRLMLRNVAGFLLHKTDKGTFGGTWRVVLAENEDVLAEIGWEPTSVDQGFKKGDNVVTISRHTGGDVVVSISGSTANEILPFIAERMKKIVGGWQLIFTISPDQPCTQRPHLILTPVLAERIAKSGWSKKEVKKYLFDHARIPAWNVEEIMKWMQKGWLSEFPTICDLVDKAAGRVPKIFCESRDPNRLLPVVCSPDDFLISVSGDPLRNNAYIFVSNGLLGFTTSRLIKLPADWDKLLKKAKGK